ncbi:MAG TPA: hypothetical protein VF123_08655 [Candidatus Sulfotelmatobacter sp.]
MTWGAIPKRQTGVLLLLIITLLIGQSWAQSNNASARTFGQSKDSIEKAVKKLQASMSGRLPVVEGFVANADQPLDRYRRAYYQTSVQVSANSARDCIVRVTTKITAWYTDPAGVHSGYRLLNSNGRLESDLLDQLSDEVAANTSMAPTPTPAPAAETTDEAAPAQNQANETTQVAQQPPAVKHASPSVAAGSPFAAPLNPSLPPRESPTAPAKPGDQDVEAEIKSLQEVLQNQGHPNNLVIVKQAGVPVVGSPSLTAKTLFLASLHDEFEMLDFNADWVHVRVSGLQRGWIWRNNLEMPDGIPDTATHAGSGPKAAAEQLFHVTREETAPFPGDWAPLKGKSVKILSIEKVDDSSKDTGLIMRLEFAKAQLEKNYDELAEKSGTLAGIVLIFDSADGGMIAATLPAMQKWKSGNLSDSAFWHQCFFDPPELGGGSGGASASSNSAAALPGHPTH